MSMGPDSSSVASTVTSGIQDISALLPLLGTDQCEEHTGSALVKGFFYTCVTPISIFGSLGIVKAGFNVLVASIIAPSWKFLGAQRLADGGFQPRGDVAKLIALDPQNPGRFLAESNLEKILEDEHIENLENVKIDLTPGSHLWNVKMALCTLIVSSIGIIPYLYIILRATNDNPLFLSGWGFPIIRLIGSAMSGIIVQFIIQIRLLVILKSRLVFLTMDRHIKPLLGKDGTELLADWRSDRASELCLWDLQMFLKREKALEARTRNSSTRLTSPTPEKEESYTGHTAILFSDSLKNNSTVDAISLETQFENMREEHLLQLQLLPWTVQYPTYIVLHILLGFGLVFSVGGYIGCFNLIQSATHIGPILWLVFEILLCLLRVIVWAWNPSWDDNSGVAFTISLTSKSPLVTCDIYGDKLESAKEIPVVRSQTFLEEIASYTGPLPAFKWNDAALYYILTGSEYRSKEATSKVLYIVVSAYKEQTSRLLVKRKDETDFVCFVSRLNANEYHPIVTINARNAIEPESHVLTADPEFMEKLSDHYDAILRRINDADQSQKFTSTWALQKIDITPSDPKRQSDNVAASTLSEADSVYLAHGWLVTRRDDYAQRLEKWVHDYLEVFEKTLLEEIPFALHNHSQMTKHQGIETNEVEYLIAEATLHLERLLLDTFKSWSQIIESEHNNMVGVVAKFFEETTEPGVGTDGPARLHDRLELEKKFRLERMSNLDYERMCKRMIACCNSVRERIGKRRYLDPREGNRIIDMWANGHGVPEIWQKIYLRGPDTSSASDFLQVIPNFAVVNSATSGMNNYEDIMNERLRRKERFLRSVEGKQVRERCQARFDTWKAKLLVVEEEFQIVKDLNFLRAASDRSTMHDTDRKLHFERRYWSKAAIQQRTLLVDHHKYVVVSKDLVDDIGGFKNLALALKHSEASILDFRCSFRLESGDGMTTINGADDDVETDYESDFSVSDDPLDDSDSRDLHTLKEETMEQIARSTPSITGIQFSNKNYHISHAVRRIIDQNSAAILARSGPQIICKFEEFEVTDYFRRNRPYVSLKDAKHSKCIMEFCVDEKVDHTLTLTQAFTALSAEIDIKLNGQSLAKIKGNRDRVANEFYHERIVIPGNRLEVRQEKNRIILKLVDRLEPDNYYLGDVVLQKKEEKAEGPVYTQSIYKEPESI